MGLLPRSRSCFCLPPSSSLPAAPRAGAGGGLRRPPRRRARPPLLLPDVSLSDSLPLLLPLPEEEEGEEEPEMSLSDEEELLPLSLLLEEVPLLLDSEPAGQGQPTQGMWVGERCTAARRKARVPGRLVLTAPDCHASWLWSALEHAGLVPAHNRLPPMPSLAARPAPPPQEPHTPH